MVSKTVDENDANGAGLSNVDKEDLKSRWKTGERGVAIKLSIKNANRSGDCPKLILSGRALQLAEVNMSIYLGPQKLIELTWLYKFDVVTPSDHEMPD